jgi:hypothetical protein
VTETPPPPEDELPDRSGGEPIPPAGPDEERPPDPTEEPTEPTTGDAEVRDVVRDAEKDVAGKLGAIGSGRSG